jgi:WD40 repeat protein
LKKKWKINPHEEIVHMKADPVNKLLITIGKEGNIYMWDQKTMMIEGCRKAIYNQSKDFMFEVKVFDFSDQFNIFMTGENESEVKVWDYSSCRVKHIIELEANPSAIKISCDFALVAIACYN